MRIILASLISIISLNCTFGQNNVQLKEEVYLITDRSVYIAGENILFSGYYSSTNKSDNEISNILYIELYDKRGICSKSKFKIIDNIISGYLQIPDDLLSGNYFIRAYTKFQRNFPTEWFNLNLISIINPNEAFPQENLTNIKQVESIIHKFSNNSLNIILRLNEKTFIDTKKVIITNIQDSLVKQVNPYKNGLVIFNWDENIGEGIIKFITNKSDTIIFSKITDIEHSYISINAEYSESKLNSINLYFDRKIVSRVNDMNLLIKSPSFEDLDIQKISLDDSGKMNIDIKNFKQNGIHNFIIMDEKDNIINIASYYILKDKFDDLGISLNKDIYRKREEVNINLNFENPADFNHAIFKITKRGLNAEDASYLPRHLLFDYNLLNSYIKYRSVNSLDLVHQINASLSLNNDQINSDSYKNQLFFKHKGPVEYIPDIREISVEGTINDKNTGEPIKDVDVFASIVYGNDQLHHYRIGKDGHFIFSLNETKNEQNLFITVKPINKDISILIKNDFHEIFCKANDIPLIADTSNINLFKQLYINQQSSKIFNKNIQNTNLEPEIEALNLSGQEDYEILMSDYVQTSTVLEIFNEIVPYVKVLKINKEYKFRIFSEIFYDTYEDPLILVDYMPVFDVNEVLKINTKKIEKIDVINQQYIIGGYQFNGVILIKTNTNDFADIKIPDNSIYLKYLTESKQSKPIFPVYNTEELLNDHKADLRNVLYFETFSGELPSKVSFYTSDSKGTYDVFFYGKTTLGDKVYSYKSFAVE